jgi:hypothetical protein
MDTTLETSFKLSRRGSFRTLPKGSDDSVLQLVWAGSWTLSITYIPNRTHSRNWTRLCPPAKRGTNDWRWLFLTDPHEWVPPPLSAKDVNYPVSETACCLEHQAMDKVQKAKNNKGNSKIHQYMLEGDRQCGDSFLLQQVPHFTCKPYHKSDTVLLQTWCHKLYLHFWPLERNLLFRERQDLWNSIKFNRTYTYNVQAAGLILWPCLNHLVINQCIINMKCTPPVVCTGTRTCTPLHTWASFPLQAHTTNFWTWHTQARAVSLPIAAASLHMAWLWRGTSLGRRLLRNWEHGTFGCILQHRTDTRSHQITHNFIAITADRGHSNPLHLHLERGPMDEPP